MTHQYGPGPDQHGELYLPTGERRPGVVVVIHGGFWRAAYDASLGGALAADLARRGRVAWNNEYRRVGTGGGWPTTFQDVADAIDFLDELGVDPSPVVAVGHSVVGHLATWAAGRAKLPPSSPGSSPRVPVTAVVSQAGVVDLSTAAATKVGGTAVLDLLGGAPNQVPERYAVADPVLQVPLSVPVVCVHGRRDRSVPFTQSKAYVHAARSAGAEAELVEVGGGHMAHVDPTSKAWAAVLEVLPRSSRL